MITVYNDMITVYNASSTFQSLPIFNDTICYILYNTILYKHNMYIYMGPHTYMHFQYKPCIKNTPTVLRHFGWNSRPLWSKTASQFRYAPTCTGRSKCVGGGGQGCKGSFVYNEINPGLSLITHRVALWSGVFPLKSTAFMSASF